MTPAEIASAEFRAETEWNGGHTVAQVLAFAECMADLDDLDEAGWTRPTVVSAGKPEPRIVAWLRRRRRS